MVRESGPMALENMEIADPFLAQGARYIADGYDRDFIRDTMERDRDNVLTHPDEGSRVCRAYGDCAPAWGLIGPMAMFANMSAPSKLGPAMATAPLATLYGAGIANLITLPLADKLPVKLEEADVSRSLIIDGIPDTPDLAANRRVTVTLLPEAPPVPNVKGLP
ncbi:motility protein A [Methylobacterium sp. WL64]|uniref:motility protein A n=1 Tax=Methylobacterium sp. WL64 TaxID=2603894 RepID=UPI001FEFA76F|nr:MotA/TolQ/ExbB proton channel family protein [Methylobacterium sp. WL64]